MGARFPSLVPDNDAGTGVFKQENLFSIVMLVKRNRLVGCQGLGKHKEIFGFPELTINLNCERNPSERTCAVYQVITLLLLAGLSEQGTRVLFLLPSSLGTVLVLLTYRDASYQHGRDQQQQCVPLQKPLLSNRAVA